jgi:hypothetical protein
MRLAEPDRRPMVASGSSRCWLDIASPWESAALLLGRQGYLPVPCQYCQSRSGSLLRWRSGFCACRTEPRCPCSIRIEPASRLATRIAGSVASAPRFRPEAHGPGPAVCRGLTFFALRSNRPENLPINRWLPVGGRTTRVRLGPGGACRPLERFESSVASKGEASPRRGRSSDAAAG